MRRIFIFGLGYTAGRIAAALEAQGWEAISTGRDGTLRFDDSSNVRLALADASHILSLGGRMPPMPDPGPEPLPALDRALRSLRTLDPDGKRRLLALCARTVESDGVLHVQEYELLRVIAGLLDCPLPLLQSVIQS